MSTSDPSKMAPKAEFFMYVGYCITAWAKVEEQLFEICAAILGTTKDRAAIVFYRTPTLSARLELVDELVFSALPKLERDGGHHHPDVVKWKNLKNDINGLSAIRRGIAHHPVDMSVRPRFRATGEPMPSDAKVSVDDIQFGSWFWIYVSQSESLRGKHKNLKPLKVDDLSVHAVDVQGMADRLQKFHAGILKAHLKSHERQASRHVSAPIRITVGRTTKPRNPPGS